MDTMAEFSTMWSKCHSFVIFVNHSGTLTVLTVDNFVSLSVMSKT